MNKILSQFYNLLSSVYIELLAFLSIVIVFSWHLTSLVALSKSEHAFGLMPLGMQALLKDPLYLPYKLIRLFAVVVFHNPAVTLRAPSLFFGLLSVIGFYFIVIHWYKRNFAIFGTLLFAAAAWTLHVSRVGNIAAIYLSVVPLLLTTYIVLQKYHNHVFAGYFVAVLWTSILFIPGSLWLLIPLILFSVPNIKKVWVRLSQWWQRILLIMIPLIGAIFLATSLYRMAALREVWIGIPVQSIKASMYGKNILGVFVHLFIRGPQYPELWLARTPLADSFTLVMAVLGIYTYIRHLRSRRTLLLATLSVIATLLIALGGPVGFSLMVPIFYLMAATGIAAMLSSWYKVFPYNPVARTAGMLVLSLAVSFSIFYNLRAYFIVWPHNTTTQATFYLKS